jgi:hypothetical protein
VERDAHRRLQTEEQPRRLDSIQARDVEVEDSDVEGQAAREFNGFCAVLGIDHCRNTLSLEELLG